MSIERLIGKPGDPIDACKVISDDIAMHWYPSPEADTCFCGVVQQQMEKWKTTLDWLAER